MQLRMEVRIDRSARPDSADVPQSIELGRPEIRLLELGPVHLREIPERNVFAAHDAVVHPVGQRIAIRAVHQEELRSKRREVRRISCAVQHQGKQRRLLSRIAAQPQDGCEMVCREVELGRRAARRIWETYGYCVCLQGVAECVIGDGGVAEVLLALTVVGAARENTRERLLRVECCCRSKCKLRWHNTVEDYAARPVGEPTYIVLGNTRSVRDSIEVDALIAESSAHRIKILYGNACRIERNVCSL